VPEATSVPVLATNIRFESSVARGFFVSSGAILLITGLAKVWSGFGNSKFLMIADPIIGITFGQLMLMMGPAEIAIALVCFFSKRQTLALGLVAWLSTNFVVYRLGLWWMDWHRPCNCLGNLTDALHISPQTADNIMKVVLAYMLIGSYGLLLRHWLRRNILDGKTATGGATRRGPRRQFLDVLGTGHFPTYSSLSCSKELARILLGVSLLAGATLSARSDGASGAQLEDPTIHTTKGYEASGYFVYTVFGDTGEPIKKENRLFNVRIAPPEWRIRIEPLEEKKNGIGYWEVANTTNGEIIEIVGFAAAYDPNKSPLRPMRAIVNGLGETANDFNHQTPVPQNPPSGNTPSRRGDLSDNVAVARHFVGDVPRADGSFASFLWFAYTKQTGLKVDSPADGLLPKVWDDGKPLDREMRDAVWTNYENAPYLVKSVLFRWSGVAKRTDSIEIKLDSSITSSNVAASYQVYSTTNLAELVLPRTFEMTRFSRVRSISDRSKKLTSLVATVVAVSLIESQSTLTIEPPGKTVVSDYRFATEQAPGKPFVYAVKTNLLLETNIIMESERYKAFANTPRSTRSKPPPATWRRGIVLAFIGIMLLSLAALMIWKG